MPFLNCVERCNQTQLVDLLPQLHADLKARKFQNTILLEFHVPWKNVAMHQQKLESDLENYLIRDMCSSAAKGLELQCSREYWDDQGENQRATAIHMLTPEEQSNLPTNNIIAE